MEAEQGQEETEGKKEADKVDGGEDGQSSPYAQASTRRDQSHPGMFMFS
jgi:hypothetical protein